jgi:hypothetical protein
MFVTDFKECINDDTGNSRVVKNLMEQFKSKIVIHGSDDKLGISGTDDQDNIVDSTPAETSFNSNSLDRKSCISSKSKHSLAEPRSLSADSPKRSLLNKIVLGDASEWGHSPKKYFQGSNPWTVFGASLVGCEDSTIIG